MYHVFILAHMLIASSFLPTCQRYKFGGSIWRHSAESFFFRNEISQVTDHPISRIEMIHQHINKHSITVEFPAGILNGTSTSFWGPLNLLPAYGYQSLQAQQHASVAQPHQNFWAPWPAWISCGQVVETLDGTMMPPNVLDWDWCLKISLHKCRQKCARSAGLTCCWALSTRCFEKAPF